MNNAMYLDTETSGLTAGHGQALFASMPRDEKIGGWK